MMSPRQQSILDRFLEDPTAARAAGDFGDLGVDRTTLFRDLQALCAQGLLQASGRGRARTYLLDPAGDAYLEWDLTRPPGERAPVRYDPGRLDGYQPNRSHLLTSDQRERLAKAGNVTDFAPAEVARKTYERMLSTLLIDLAYASSNLEGVRISWLDTKTLIEFGERPRGLDERQVRLVLNHKAAIGHLVEHRNAIALSRRDLFDLHRLLIEDLLGDPGAAGALRERVVRFDDSRYLPPDNPHQLREGFELFVEKALAIEDPYEQAFFAMTFLPYLQPFEDGNKRTSRLAMNIPLIRHALAPFAFADIGKRDYLFGLLAFYERGRHEFLARAFVTAYERSARRYAELAAYVSEGGTLNTVAEPRPRRRGPAPG